MVIIITIMAASIQATRSKVGEWRHIVVYRVIGIVGWHQISYHGLLPSYVSTLVVMSLLVCYRMNTPVTLRLAIQTHVNCCRLRRCRCRDVDMKMVRYAIRGHLWSRYGAAKCPRVTISQRLFEETPLRALMNIVGRLREKVLVYYYYVKVSRERLASTCYELRSRLVDECCYHRQQWLALRLR